MNLKRLKSFCFACDSYMLNHLNMIKQNCVACDKSDLDIFHIHIHSSTKKFHQVIRNLQMQLYYIYICTHIIYMICRCIYIHIIFKCLFCKILNIKKLEKNCNVLLWTDPSPIFCNFQYMASFVSYIPTAYFETDSRYYILLLVNTFSMFF